MAAPPAWPGLSADLAALALNTAGAAA